MTTHPRNNTPKQLRHVAAMLPQVFTPPAANTNASKQVSTTYLWLAQRAGEVAARAAAMADEIDAGIRVEAQVPVLRLRAGGLSWMAWCVLWLVLSGV